MQTPYEKLTGAQSVRVQAWFTLPRFARTVAWSAIFAGAAHYVWGLFDSAKQAFTLAATTEQTGFLLRYMIDLVFGLVQSVAVGVALLLLLKMRAEQLRLQSTKSQEDS